MKDMFSEEVEITQSGTESSDEEAGEDKFALVTELMERSRKRKLSKSPGLSPPPELRKRIKISQGGQIQGIRFNAQRNKFEASVAVLNEIDQTLDEFVLGYFDTEEWAIRVRDAWIILHKVRNNKLNLNGKFDAKACAQVQKMNSVLREHIKADHMKHKTMVSLLQNVMKKEKAMSIIVSKIRGKIMEIDAQSPIIEWIDGELMRLRPPMAHLAEKMQPKKPNISVKKECLRNYWSIRTDGELIKLFGKHGNDYIKIATELRNKYHMPYDEKMVDERISRLTRSIKKRAKQEKIAQTYRKTWTREKDATLINLVKKFGEDYQFLSTAMGDEFTVNDLKERVQAIRNFNNSNL